MPDNDACTDLTIIAAAAHQRPDTPRRLRQLARHHDSGSHLAPFLPLPSSCMAAARAAQPYMRNK